MLIGIIGFIMIPALLWTPVTSEEQVRQVRQAHLVRRYELQTQADIAILRTTLLRSQEKEELAGVMRGLVKGIDQTLRDIGDSVKTMRGATVPSAVSMTTTTSAATWIISTRASPTTPCSPAVVAASAPRPSSCLRMGMRVATPSVRASG